MAWRKSIRDRLDRLSPPVVGGGVRHLDDLESGDGRLDDLPTLGGGYLLMPQPCQTAAEWARQFGGVKYPGGRPPAPKEIL